MRRMLGTSVFDHMTNEELHARTESIPLADMIRERRLRFIGYIAGDPAQRWVRAMLGAGAQGYSGGSQKKTWLKTVAEDLRRLHSSWEDCMDRERWRKICNEEIVLRVIDQAPVGSIRHEMRDRRRRNARIIDGGARRLSGSSVNTP